MGFYKVLSKPAATCVSSYKGLYRLEPFSKTSEDVFMLLWEIYVQYNTKSIGVTTELSIDELKELADLAAKTTGDYYEVIYFSESFECPHQAEYYGIDVAGFGGYSMVGENFFKDSEIKDKLYDIINQHFRVKLNSNGLFNDFKDAVSFCTVLNDISKLSPGSIEQED